MFLAIHIRDRQYDFHIREEIPFQASHVLAYNKKDGDAPWFTSCCILFIMDLFLVGWIQRIWLNKQTKKIYYKLIKLVKY